MAGVDRLTADMTRDFLPKTIRGTGGRHRLRAEEFIALCYPLYFIDVQYSPKQKVLKGQLASITDLHFHSTILLWDPRQVSLPLCAPFSKTSKGATK